MSSHTDKVEQQFGSLAEAYLLSAVHRQGDDLVAIADRLKSAPDARELNLLDLGCGAGHLSYAVAPHVGRVTAYDLSSAMIGLVSDEAARRGLSNISVKQGNVEELPFENDSFDWICTRYSAHHWTDVPRALDECRRVLKPGGTMVVIDSCSPQNPLLDTHLQTIELLRDVSHVRDYTLLEWSSMLREAGTEPRTHSFWKVPLGFASWMGRMKTPDIYVEAIRSLLQNAPEEVRDYFQVTGDGSFELDTLLIEAR